MPFSDFIQTLETERGSTERSGNDRGVVERVGGRVKFIGKREREREREREIERERREWSL